LIGRGAGTLSGVGSNPFMTDYSELFAECLAEMEKPLPKECRLAGGCPKCYRDLIEPRAQARKRLKGRAKREVTRPMIRRGATESR
jgi:hypothetical protein